MGGVFVNPPPPDSGIPAAPDVAPVNQTDWSQLANALIAAGKAAGAPALSPDAQSDAWLKTIMEALALFFGNSPAWAKAGIKDVQAVAELILKFLVDSVFILLQPVRDTAGDVAKNYVGLFAEEQSGNRPGNPVNSGSKIGGAAAAAFDGILKPLGFLGGETDPSQPGAGEAASQFVLGSLVNLHLSTWVVNIMSNLTGLGALKFLDDFDDVILAAMNTRAFGRLAFRPFLTTYMVNPTTRDLNRKWPLSDTGPQQYVKDYLRGGLTAEEMKAKLREKGFDDTVAAQILLDTTKELSTDEVGALVNDGYWTSQQGVEYLTMIGYDSNLALVVLNSARYKETARIYQLFAAEVVSEIAAKEMDPAVGERLLTELGIPSTEVHAWTQLAALKQERAKRVSYGQVRELFNLGIVDLSYVETWLTEEGYGQADVTNLILLDFTARDQLTLQQAYRGAHDRLLSVERAAAAVKATAAHETALANANSALSAKYADLASKYGG